MGLDNQELVYVIEAFHEVIESVTTEDRMQQVMASLVPVEDALVNLDQIVNMVNYVLPFAHIPERIAGVRVVHTRKQVVARLNSVEMERRESSLLKDHASIWLIKQVDGLFLAMEHRFGSYIPVSQRLALVRALEMAIIPAIGRRSAELYDLSRELREARISLDRISESSWDSFLLRLEETLMMRGLSVLQQAEGIVEPPSKQASVARFVRGRLGEPWNVMHVADRLESLSDDEWELVSNLMRDARMKMEELTVAGESSVSDFFIPMRVDKILASAKSSWQLKQAVFNARQLLDSQKEHINTMARGMLFDTLGMWRPEVINLRGVYSQELFSFVSLSQSGHIVAHRLEDWDRLDEFLATRAAGETLGVTWTAKEAGSRPIGNPVNLRTAIESITTAADQDRPGPAIPPASYADIELIAAIERMQTGGNDSLRQLVWRAIEMALPTLTEYQKLGIARFFKSLRSEIDPFRTAIRLARIADIRLLAFDAELAMNAFNPPISRERLGMIRRIISTYLNIHSDIDFGEDLSRYLSTLADEQLPQVVTGMELLVTACKDFEADSTTSGFTTHPAISLMNYSQWETNLGLLFNRINSYLPAAMLHRAGRVFDTTTNDGLVLVRSPMESVARVSSLMDAIYRAPWFGMATWNLERIGEKIQREVFRLPSIVFNAYYGERDLVHRPDFAMIKAGVEEYVTATHAFLQAVSNVDRFNPELDVQVVKVHTTTFRTVFRGLLVSEEDASPVPLVTRIREASALLRTATYQLAMLSEI